MNCTSCLLAVVLGMCGLGVSNARAQNQEPIRQDVICPPADRGWGYTVSSLPKKTDASNSTPLQILRKPIGRYTQTARDLCIQGKVLLKVKFRSDAKIGTISVVRGLPYGLSEKAVEAAKLMRFSPEKRRGKTRTVTKLIEYNFFIY